MVGGLLLGEKKRENMAKIREQEEGLLCEWPVFPDSIEGKDMSVFPMGFMGTKEVPWKTKQTQEKETKDALRDEDGEHDTY